MRRGVFASSLAMAGVLLLLGGGSALAGGEAVFTLGSLTYTVNDQVFSMDVPPLLVDGRVFLPVRFLAYALGVPPDGVSWSGSGPVTVSLSTGLQTVTMTEGSDLLKVNGSSQTMDVSPFVRNGRMYLPARWLAGAFGDAVSWDAQTDQVRISLGSPPGNGSSSDGGIDSSDGATLYAERCAACHGSAGQGGMAPSFADMVRDHPDAGSLAGFIQANMPLGAGGSLNAAQAASLAAYILGGGSALPGNIVLNPIDYGGLFPVVSRTVRWEYGGRTFTWTLQVPRRLLDEEAVMAPANYAGLLIFSGASADVSASYQHYLDNLLDDPDSNGYVQVLADLLQDEANELHLGRYAEADFISRFVQSLPYQILLSNTEYPPQAVAVGGDCINMSVLLAALLRDEGYPVVILVFPQARHAAVGVGFDPKQIPQDIAEGPLAYFNYGGLEYFYVQADGGPFHVGVEPATLCSTADCSQTFQFAGEGYAPEIFPVTPEP